MEANLLLKKKKLINRVTNHYKHCQHEVLHSSIAWRVRPQITLPLNSYACFNKKSVKWTFEGDGVPSSSVFILGGTEYIAIKFSNAKGLVVESWGKRPLGRPWRMWEDIFEVHLKEMDEMVWTDRIWLQTETSGSLLWPQQHAFEFHKIRKICRVTEEGLTS
jgi:hypothetical protein